MDVLEYHSRPTLRRPVMIAAFRGWNDAAESATSAAAHLREVWNATKLASIDPEEFFDFQVARPTVVLKDGITREVVWPATEFWAAELEGQERDALILQGIEPSMRWRTFCNTILQVAQEAGVEQLITLGGIAAAVPHSRPVRIMGTTPTAELADKLRLTVSRYQGPTGIVSVIADFFRRADIPAISLWASLPHYVSSGSGPSPKGASALIRRVGELTDLSADTGKLDRAVPDYEERVGKAVAEDPEVANYVRMLERQADQQAQNEPPQREPVDLENLPSGDDLAAEFERFLREERGD